jgi:flagellar biosynthesis protein FlhF
MRVKRYCAKTIQEATDRVKTSLGPDAMIISTRRLDGTEGNELFEITAVADGETPFKEGTPLAEVKNELMSLREMIYLLNVSGSGGMMEKLAMNPDSLMLCGRLIRKGVSQMNAHLFLERAGAFNGACSDPLHLLEANVLKEIKKILEVKDTFNKENGKQIVAAFIGTTGVGKTTTIAKLAAQLMLNGGKNVGLISIDGYRIGALEQLKSYANILGIPCFRAFNRKDLAVAIKRLEGKDVVLIDTAGQSHYDIPRMEELSHIISCGMDISSHLLLSVSTSETEMKRSAVHFSPLKFQSYIFTKIDESEVCGSILNQIVNMNLPISFITTGQNVPEDIEKANKGRILKLLFNNN